MSLAIVHSRAQVGVEAPIVTVEAHLANGLPSMAVKPTDFSSFSVMKPVAVAATTGIVRELPMSDVRKSSSTS